MTRLFSIPFCRPSSSMPEINSRFIAHSPATVTISFKSPHCGDLLRYSLKRHGTPSVSNGAELQHHLPLRTPIVHHDCHALFIHFHQLSDHTPLPVDRLPELHVHLFPQCPTIILNSFEGSIQTRRGDFQCIGMGERISYIQGRTDRKVCTPAILYRNAARFIDIHAND